MHELKRILLVFAVVVLSACSQRGTEQPITVKVVEVFEDTAPMGCMGTNWNTTVRDQTGRMSRLCGRYGKPGDTLRGCWISGADGDYAWRNGFRLECAAPSPVDADAKENGNAR